MSVKLSVRKVIIDTSAALRDCYSVLILYVLEHIFWCNTLINPVGTMVWILEHRCGFLGR